MDASGLYTESSLVGRVVLSDMCLEASVCNEGAEALLTAAKGREETTGTDIGTEELAEGSDLAGLVVGGIPAAAACM